MSINENMLTFGIFGFFVYGMWELGQAILIEIDRHQKKKKFLEQQGDKVNTVGEIKNLKHGEYVIMEGTAEKIYERNSELLDNNIIMSLGNPNYYEDFFLNSDSGKVVLQPYSNTRFHQLTYMYLTESKTTWQKISKFLFFKKSGVILKKERLYVFGKVIKDSNDIPSDLQSYVNIVPKEITTTTLSDLKYYVPEKHSKSIFIKTVFFLSLGIFAGYVFKDFLLPKITNLFGKGGNKYVERRSQLCSKCQSKPTHVLCKQCSNFTNFCETCLNDLKHKNEVTSLVCEYCKSIPNEWIVLKLNLI